MKAPLVAVLLAGTFALGACSSDDDDDGGDGMTPPVTGAPEEAPVGDIFDIAGRGDADEPARLDAAALAAQLGGFLGDGDSVEPVGIEDGDDVATALRRQQQAGGAN